jgi:hypothetical protein
MWDMDVIGIMGLRNNLFHNPSQPIGKDFGNVLINSTHKTNMPKVFEINSPRFLWDKSNERVALRQDQTYYKHESHLDHITTSLEESHRKPSARPSELCLLERKRISSNSNLNPYFFNAHFNLGF